MTRRLLHSIWLCCWISICFNGRAYADTLKFVADDWCPYNCNPSNEQAGLAVDLAREIFQSAGHAIEYNLVPWSRAIAETREGKYDAIIGAYKEDAPDFIFPDRSIAISEERFFVKNDSTWRYTGIPSLSQVSLGVIRGYAYGKELDSYVAEHEKTPSRIQVASGDQALQTNIMKLLAGRVGAIVDDGVVVRYSLKKNDLVGVIIDAGALSGQPIYIAFSPAKAKSREYAKILSNGIESFKSTGRYDEIVKRYDAHLNPVSTRK